MFNEQYSLHNVRRPERTIETSCAKLIPGIGVKGILTWRIPGERQ